MSYYLYDQQATEQSVDFAGYATEVKIFNTQNGAKIARFSLARSTKKNGEDVSEWTKCVAWNEMADRIEAILHKGDHIVFKGTLVNSKDQCPHCKEPIDGKEARVDTVRSVTPKGSAPFYEAPPREGGEQRRGNGNGYGNRGQNQNRRPQPQTAKADEFADNDDLPF